MFIPDTQKHTPGDCVNLAMPDWATVWTIVAVAVIPVNDLGKICVAFLAKRLGVSPDEIKRYQDVTDDGDTND